MEKSKFSQYYSFFALSFCILMFILSAACAFALSARYLNVQTAATGADVFAQTKTILSAVMILGMILILSALIFCAVLFQLLLRQKRRLQTQQRRYEALAQFNDILLFEYDAASDLVVFTPNAPHQLDLERHSPEGLPAEYYIQQLVHPDDRNAFRTRLHPSVLILDKTYCTEARIRCADGRYNWFRCQFKSIENDRDGSCRISGKLVDISDQRGREQVLRQAALRDVLTGVYNRSAETLINRLLEKNEQGLFFMLDLDDFKEVNDTYGHAAGDLLLNGVARILSDTFRPDDIIARVGGDEFTVFLTGNSDPQVAKEKAEIILSRIEQLRIPGADHAVSVSIGAACAPKDGITYDTLTRAADEAMYAIKQQSKKGFSLYHKA